MGRKDWYFKLVSQQTINSPPSQNFIIENFTYIEQSKEVYSEHQCPHHLDYTSNILLYLVITCLS